MCDITKSTQVSFLISSPPCTEVSVELGRQTTVEEHRTPAVPVRQSVRPDYVVCLECGYRGQMLRRHLTSRHGLSRLEYLNRWGLSPDHPLTAPAYSEHRSVLAKELGLGRRPRSKAGAEPAEFALGNGEEKIDAHQAAPSEGAVSVPQHDMVDEGGSPPKKPR